MHLLLRHRVFLVFRLHCHFIHQDASFCTHLHLLCGSKHYKRVHYMWKTKINSRNQWDYNRSSSIVGRLSYFCPLHGKVNPLVPKQNSNFDSVGPPILHFFSYCFSNITHPQNLREMFLSDHPPIQTKYLIMFSCDHPSEISAIIASPKSPFLKVFEIRFSRTTLVLFEYCLFRTNHIQSLWILFLSAYPS